MAAELNPIMLEFLLLLLLFVCLSLHRRWLLLRRWRGHPVEPLSPPRSVVYDRDRLQEGGGGGAKPDPAE